MSARTRKRAKFDFQGRPFVWWVEDDYYLRIASLDKKFVIAYPIYRRMEDPPVIEVIGQEFPGLSPSYPRPCWFVVPEMSGKTMGAWVDALLTWAFDPNHELVSWTGPPRFM